MGVGSLHIFYLLNLNRGLGAEPPSVYRFWKYTAKGMLQLKFCLKFLEICSLLYVSVIKCSILAIILFEHLLLDTSAREAPNCSREKAKNFKGA